MSDIASTPKIFKHGSCWPANDTGLTDFNVKALAARMLLEIKPIVSSSGKVIRHGKSEIEMVAAYITAHAQQINKTNTFPQRGQNLNVSVISAPHMLPVRVHVASDLDRCRIEEQHLKEWITREFGGGSRLLKYLKDKSKVTECRGSLAFGLPSNVNTKRPRLIELPLP